MPYASQDDLVAKFGENEIIMLSDDAGAAIQTDIVARILSDVQDDMDGYLAARFTLPLSQVPSALVNIACDLARYGLATRNGTTRATDDMIKRFDAANRKLKDIAAGKFALTDTAAGAALPGNGLTQVAGGTPVFRQDELRDFMPMNRRRNPFGTY